MRTDNPQKPGRARPKPRTPAFHRVVEISRLLRLHRAVDLVAGSDESRRAEHRAIVDRLVAQTAQLDLLLTYARSYQEGDSLALRRFATVLRLIGQRTPRGQGMTPGHPPEEPPGSYPNGEPLSGAPSRLAAIRSDCFVPPSAVGDIFITVLGLCDVEPRFCPDYVAAADAVFAVVDLLEVVYAAASDVVAGVNARTIGSFKATLAVADAWSRGETGPEPVLFSVTFGNPEPFPAGVRTVRSWFDPCGLEKWAATRDAWLCYKQLGEEPRYRIDDIVNLTRRADGAPASRQACVGDLIEIRGENISPSARVVFPGGIAAEDYPTVSGSRVQCRVPPGARSGDIRLLMPVSIPECARGDMDRLEATDSNAGLEVLEPLEVDTFRVDADFVRRYPDEHRLEVEACHPAWLRVQLRRAESATVADEEGTVLWDSGPGEPRDLEARIEIDTLTTHTYTLQARSFCVDVSPSITVDVLHRLVLSARETEVEAGDTIALTARVSCPAPDDGLTVRLESSNPAVAAVPPTVVIPGDETVVDFSATTAAGCAMVFVTADADGYESVRYGFLVYQRPVIRSISPTTISACSDEESVTIYGDCFAWTGGNTVQVFDGDEWRNLPVLNLERGEHDLFASMQLTVDASQLPPGRWEIQLRSRGLLAEERFEALTASGVSAVIGEFTTTPDRVRYNADGEGTAIRLDWTVQNAKYVRVVSDVRGEVVPLRHYRGACMPQSDSADLTVNESHVFTLEAYTHTDATPQTRTVELRATGVPADGVSPVGYRSVRIRNCHVEGRTVTVYLIDWDSGEIEEIGELGSRYDDYGLCVGDEIEVELPHGHWCNVVAFDPGEPLCDDSDPLALITGSSACRRLTVPGVGSFLGDSGGGVWPRSEQVV